MSFSRKNVKNKKEQETRREDWGISMFKKKKKKKSGKGD